MSTYKTILVAVSPEMRVTPAFQRGVELARRTGATLQLCLFAYHSLIDAARNMVGIEVAQLAEAEFVNQRMAWLSQQAAELSERGLRVECDVVWAPVGHEAVLGKVLETHADLMLKDLPYDKRTPPRLHLSSQDWRLARLVPCPLMFVRPDAALLPRQLVAAVQVDPRPTHGPQLNHRILDIALDCARICEAPVDALSVFNYMPLENNTMAYTPAIYDLVNHAHREAFEQLMGEYPLPRERQHRYFGEPADAIRQGIKEVQADLVVIGSSYHSGLNRVLFGSTADAVLREIGTDVLLVKPEGFVDELGRHIDLQEVRRRYARTQMETPNPGRGM
jgi:universal stress protein E